LDPELDFEIMGESSNEEGSQYEGGDDEDDNKTLAGEEGAISMKSKGKKKKKKKKGNKGLATGDTFLEESKATKKDMESTMGIPHAETLAIDDIDATSRAQPENELLVLEDVDRSIKSKKSKKSVKRKKTSKKKKGQEPAQVIDQAPEEIIEFNQVNLKEQFKQLDGQAKAAEEPIEPSEALPDRDGLESKKSKRSKKGGKGSRSSSKRREKSQEEDVLGGDANELKPDFEAEAYSPSRKRAAAQSFEDPFKPQDDDEDGRLN
jgi:hypothetical protein